MHRLLPIAAAILIQAAPAIAGDGGTAGRVNVAVREFGDWSVACDNARECTAVNVSRAYETRVKSSDPGDYVSPKLWIRRGAAPGDRPRIFVDTSVWGDVKPLGALSLHVYYECDGDCTGRAYRISEIEPGRYELNPREVDGFLVESAKSSSAATRRSNGTMHGIISTSGMMATMLHMDDAQKRTGTVTAMSMRARGDKPASTVPPKPMRERVRAVRGISEPSTEMPDHREMQRIRGEYCKGPHDPNETNIQRFRLQNGQALWSIICAGTPHNPTHLWLVETKTDRFEIVRLARPDQGLDATVPIIPHSLFDPASGLLTAYYAGEEVGSCGWKRRWAWTGTRFAMIDAVEMPPCLGIQMRQWLQTYRAIPE